MEAVEAKCQTFQKTLCAIYPSQGGGGGGSLTNFSKHDFFTQYLEGGRVEAVEAV